MGKVEPLRLGEKNWESEHRGKRKAFKITLIPEKELDDYIQRFWPKRKKPKVRIIHGPIV